MQTKRNTSGKFNVRAENTLIRLNKFLADSGLTSRRKADELIKQGSVSVNNKIVTDLGTKIQSNDRVKVNGNPVKINQKLVYILLNKPKDYISTTSDEKGRKTILDIVKSSKRIFPVGRLDRNTTGVLLLTNDGELAHKLTHPSFEIERVYNVTLDKNLLPPDAKKIVSGIEIDNEMTSPCELFINPQNKSNVIITLTEGKNHEVKKIFEKLGYAVKKLDRKYFAGLSASGLGRGKYRHLKLPELLKLKKLTGLL
ncbi:MAG: rRNA pseudouridine synthase [Ignavibacteriae bacterium]|nr:rRNA pseudouridine synthase [Ignavibacteriota bacterium]